MSEEDRSGAWTKLITLAKEAEETALQNEKCAYALMEMLKGPDPQAPDEKTEPATGWQGSMRHLLSGIIQSNRRTNDVLEKLHA